MRMCNEPEMRRSIGESRSSSGIVNAIWNGVHLSGTAQIARIRLSSLEIPSMNSVSFSVPVPASATAAQSPRDRHHSAAAGWRGYYSTNGKRTVAVGLAEHLHSQCVVDSRCATACGV